MDDKDQALDDILGQTAWIRGLARRLVADAAERDDVVQQVWVETLRKGSRARALRPWLFGVLRNVARTELRRGASRRAREEAAEPATAPPQPDELVERVELEREVATALLEIAEPYRSTLLLRYYEDLSPTEIARRLRIPAGTVRWRLKHGLELLRANLDARFSGDRRRWALALVPTAAAARGGLGKVAIATIGGLLIMKASTKVAAAIVILLAFVAGGVAFWRHSTVPSEVSRARPGMAWRVPGGIGATLASPPTVEGVKVPSWFGQRGAPLRRIAGIVTFAGAPVANATVELASDLTDAGLLKPAKIRTRDDGRFDFGTQPPAVFSVAATAEGRSAAIVAVDTRDPRSAAERLELRLGGCESSLSGHVSDSSGGPIVGAKVCLAPPRASACMPTDASGAYRTCLTTRQNIISVAASGYGAIYEHIEYVGHPLQRDYVLAPEATLSGRVVRADTNAPVAQASVHVASADRAIRFAAPGATMTNDAGRFTLSGLAGGRYRVRAFAEGLATTDAIEINVEAGRATGEVLLRLTPASRVSGVVTDGRDAIVGATVSLGNGPGSIDAVTQSDGSFVLDPVGKGLATLSVRDYEVREPKTLKIDRSELSGVHVLVDGMGSIAGRVTYQGKPAACPQVYAAMGRPPTTGELDGTYVVRGLPQGRYQVSAGDQTVSAFSKLVDVVLGKGEHRTGVDFEIVYEAAISGIVVEPDGKPLGGVSVFFDRPDFNDGGRDLTAPDGTFRVRTLMGGGKYRARVGGGMLSNVLLKLVGDPPVVELKDGTSEVSGVRLVVQRDHLSIAGTTVDADGQPLSDIRVVAFRTDDPTGLMMDDLFAHPGAISVADGSYLIENLDAGSYVVRARAGDGSEGLARGVAAGQKNVVVTLQRAGAIDGTLVGFSSQPAVQAARMTGFHASVVATVDGDRFHVAGLSPGKYRVWAIGAEADAKSVDVAAGQTATVTLQSRGTTTIRGRVVDFVSGAGVAGMGCSPGLRTAPGRSATSIIDSIVAFSDEDGAFVIEGAPTGNVSVGCRSNSAYWTGGQVELTDVGSQGVTCVVPVVKIDPALPTIDTGAVVDPSVLPARFNLVRPKSAADRAGIRVGDLIVTVDGADIASLTPMGIAVLVNERPPGTTVHLGLNRNGQPATADLVIPSQ